MSIIDLNRSLITISVVILVLVFSGNGLGKQKPGEELRVLFVANSLTYVNDLPAIIAAIAEADGHNKFIYQTVASPDFSLEYHWKQGDARKKIAEGRWDFVVLQQGPSALPESRASLLEFTARFATDIRRAGAKPALYMVWPSQARQADFDRVSESYRLAAAEVGGVLFPVGEAWRAAWRRNPKLALYSSDGFHPTVLGSYLAALVLYEKLYGAIPAKLPSQLKIRSKALGEIKLGTEDIEIIQAAAREANQKFVGL